MQTDTKKPLSRAVVAELSYEDLLVELARRGVTAAPEPDVLRQRSTCPHCGHEGPVGRDFGLRILRGVVKPQSWCRECRANPTSAQAARRRELRRRAARRA